MCSAPQGGEIVYKPRFPARSVTLRRTLEKRMDGKPDDTWYLSIRVTIDPEHVKETLDGVLKHGNGPFKDQIRAYCYVNHNSDEHDNNKHSHVYLRCIDEQDAKKAKQTLAKRFDAIGLRGNAKRAITIFGNGFKSFAFYTKHDDDVLMNGSEEQNELYAASEKYVKPEVFDRDAKNLDINDSVKPFKTLTEANLIKVMRQFCRLKRIGTRNFDEVFVRLLAESEWRPNSRFPRPLNPNIIKEFETGGGEPAAKGWLEYLKTNPQRCW